MQAKKIEPDSVSTIQMQYLDFTLLTGLESSVMCFEILAFLFGLTDKNSVEFNLKIVRNKGQFTKDSPTSVREKGWSRFVFLLILNV